MEDLLGALDNEKNDAIMSMTHRKIKQQKNDIDVGSCLSWLWHFCI